MKHWILRHPGTAFALALALSCGPSIAQVALEWRDYATLFGYTGAKFDFTVEGSAPVTNPARLAFVDVAGVEQYARPGGDVDTVRA